MSASVPTSAVSKDFFVVSFDCGLEEEVRGFHRDCVISFTLDFEGVFALCSFFFFGSIPTSSSPSSLLLSLFTPAEEPKATNRWESGPAGYANRGGFCVAIDDEPCSSSGVGFGGWAVTMRRRGIDLGAARKRVRTIRYSGEVKKENEPIYNPRFFDFRLVTKQVIPFIPSTPVGLLSPASKRSD